MRMPFDLREYDEHGVEIICRVTNLYGSLSAGRNHYDFNHAHLRAHNFEPSPTDPGIWIRPKGPPTFDLDPKPDISMPTGATGGNATNGGIRSRLQAPKARVGHGMEELESITMIVWTDDYVWECPCDKTNKWLADMLVNRWDPEHTKPPPAHAAFVLGMGIHHHKGTISMTSTSLVDKLVTKMGMEAAHPKKTPLVAGTVISHSEGGTPLAPPEHRLYRTGTAAVLHLSQTTRPDLAYAASQLGKVQAKPTDVHMNHLRRVVAYAKGTRNFGIRFGKVPHPGRMHGSADASWADDRDSRRSTIGHIFFVQGGAISWSSRVAPSVALSTAESEIHALSEAIKTAIHLRGTLEHIELAQQRPTAIGEDASAAIAFATDASRSVSSRQRHIAVRYEFVRDAVTGYTDPDTMSEVQPVVRVYKVDTHDNEADLFTKALAEEPFIRHRSKMVHDCTSILHDGGVPARQAFDIDMAHVYTMC